MKKKLFLSIIFTTFLLCLNGFANIIIKSEKKYEDNLSNEFIVIDKKAINNEIDKLRNTYNNKEIIGKIIINGTHIEEILVQGINNDYYLNHNIQNQKNIIGSTFLDYRNNLNDRKLLIYGHNSKTLKDIPFKELEKFLKKDFFNKYKYINLNLEGIESKWEIFSIMIIKPGDYTHTKISFNDLEWNKHIEWIKQNSIYFREMNIKQNDKIITIQTCYYNPNDSYLIINAKKI